MKFDKNGRYIKSVGTRGNGHLQFNTPHGMAMDWQGNVYIADRGNGRVVVLDNDLNWKANYTRRGNGRVCVSGGPVKNSSSTSSPRIHGRTAPPRALLDTRARSTRWNSTAPSSESSGKAGKAPGEFATVHGIDCRDPNVLYTAEINNWRAQKIVLKPIPAKAGN